MGIEPIRLEEAVVEYGRLMVRGEGFTEFSTVIAGDEALDTVFIDENRIAVPVPDEVEEVVETVCVAQRSPDGKELGRTEEIPIVRYRAHQ